MSEDLLSSSVRVGGGSDDDEQRRKASPASLGRQYTSGGEGLGQRFDIHVSDGKVYLNGEHAPSLRITSRKNPLPGGNNIDAGKSARGEEFFLVEVDPETGTEKDVIMGLLSNGDGSFKNVTGAGGMRDVGKGMPKVMSGRLAQMTGGIINLFSPYGRGLMDMGERAVAEGEKERTLGGAVASKGGVSPQSATMSAAESAPMMAAIMGVGTGLRKLGLSPTKSFVATTAGVGAGESRNEMVQRAEEQAAPGEEPDIPSRWHTAMPGTVSGTTALLAPGSVQRFMTGQMRRGLPDQKGETTRSGVALPGSTQGGIRQMMVKGKDLGAYEGMQEVPEEYSQYLALKGTHLDASPITMDESLETMAMAGISGGITGIGTQGAFKVFGLTGDALITAKRAADEVMNSLLVNPGDYDQTGDQASFDAELPEGQVEEDQSQLPQLGVEPDVFDSAIETGSEGPEDILTQSAVEKAATDNIAAAQGVDNVKTKAAEALEKRGVPPQVAKSQADEMIDSAIRLRNVAGSFKDAQAKLSEVGSAEQWKNLTGLDHTERGWQSDMQDMAQILKEVEEGVHPEYVRALTIMDEVENAPAEQEDPGLNAKRLLYYMAMDRRKKGEDMKAAIVRISNEGAMGGVARTHAMLELTLANMRYGENVARAAPFLVLEALATNPEITPAELVMGVLDKLTDGKGQIRKDGMLGAFEIGGLHNLFMEMEGPFGEAYRQEMAKLPPEQQSFMQGEILAKVSKGALKGVGAPSTRTTGEQWIMHARGAMDRRDATNGRFEMLLAEGTRGNKGAKWMRQFGDDEARMVVDPNAAAQAWKDNVKAKAAGWLALYKAISSSGRQHFDQGLPESVVKAEGAGIFIKTADKIARMPGVKRAMDTLGFPEDLKHRAEAILPLMPLFVKTMMVKAQAKDKDKHRPAKLPVVDTGSEAARQARAETKERKKKDATPGAIAEARQNWRMARGMDYEGEAFKKMVAVIDQHMGTGRGTMKVNLPEEAALPIAVAMGKQRGYQEDTMPSDTKPGDIVFGLSREDTADSEVQEWTVFRGRVVDNSEDKTHPREAGWLKVEVGKGQYWTGQFDTIPEGALFTGGDEKTSGVNWGAQAQSPASVEHKIGFTANLQTRLQAMREVPSQEGDKPGTPGRPPLSEDTQKERTGAKADAKNVRAAAQESAQKTRDQAAKSAKKTRATAQASAKKTKGKAQEQADKIVGEAKDKAAGIVQAATSKAAAAAPTPQPAAAPALTKRETETKARYQESLESAEAQLDALAKTRPTDSDEMTDRQIALHHEQAALELSDARAAMDTWGKPTPGHGSVVNKHLVAANKSMRSLQTELNRSVGKKAVSDAVAQAEQARLQAEEVRNFAGEEARFDKIREELGTDLKGTLGHKVNQAHKTATDALENAKRDIGKAGKFKAAVDKYEQAAERYRSALTQPVSKAPVTDAGPGEVSAGKFAHRDRKMWTRWGRVVKTMDPYYMDSRANAKAHERDAKVKEAHDLLEKISSQEKPTKKDTEKFGKLMDEVETLHRDYRKTDDATDKMSMSTDNVRKVYSRIDRTRDNVRDFLLTDMSEINEDDRNAHNAEMFVEAHEHLMGALQKQKPRLLRAKVRKMTALATGIKEVVDDTDTPMTTRLRKLDPLLDEHRKTSASLLNELTTKQDDGTVDLTGFVNPEEADAAPAPKPKTSRERLDQDIAPEISTLAEEVTAEDTDLFNVDDRLAAVQAELTEMIKADDVKDQAERAPKVESLRAAVKAIKKLRGIIDDEHSAAQIREGFNKVAAPLGFSLEGASLPDALSKIRNIRGRIRVMKGRTHAFPQISEIGHELIGEAADYLLAIGPHIKAIGKRAARIKALRDSMLPYIRGELDQRAADGNDPDAQVALHIQQQSKAQRQKYLDTPEGKKRTQLMHEFNAFERILREAEDAVAAISWERETDQSRAAMSRRDAAKDRIKTRGGKLKAEVDKVKATMRQHEALTTPAKYLVRRYNALKAFYDAVSKPDVVPDEKIDEFMFRWDNAAQDLMDNIEVYKDLLAYIDEGIIPEDTQDKPWPKKEEAVLDRARSETFKAVREMDRLERVLDHDGFVSGIFKTAEVVEVTDADVGKKGKDKAKEAKVDPKTGQDYSQAMFTYAFPVRNPEGQFDWEKADLTENEVARLKFTGQMYHAQKRLRYLINSYRHRKDRDTFKKEFVEALEKTNQLINKATEWAESNLSTEATTPLRSVLGAVGGRGKKPRSTMKGTLVESGIGKLNRQKREAEAGFDAAATLGTEEAKAEPPKKKAKPKTKTEQAKEKRQAKEKAATQGFSAAGFMGTAETEAEATDATQDVNMEGVAETVDDDKVREELKKIVEAEEKAKEKPETPGTIAAKKELDEFKVRVRNSGIVDLADKEAKTYRGRKHLSQREIEKGQKGVSKEMLAQVDKYQGILEATLTIAENLQTGHTADRVGNDLFFYAMSVFSALKVLRQGMGKPTDDIDKMWNEVGSYSPKWPTRREREEWKKEQRKKAEKEAAELEQDEEAKRARELERERQAAEEGEYETEEFGADEGADDGGAAFGTGQFFEETEQENVSGTGEKQLDKNDLWSDGKATLEWIKRRHKKVARMAEQYIGFDVLSSELAGAAKTYGEILEALFDVPQSGLRQLADEMEAIERYVREKNAESNVLFGEEHGAPRQWVEKEQAKTDEELLREGWRAQRDPFAEFRARGAALLADKEQRKAERAERAEMGGDEDTYDSINESWDMPAKSRKALAAKVEQVLTKIMRLTRPKKFHQGTGLPVRRRVHGYRDETEEALRTEKNPVQRVLLLERRGVELHQDYQRKLQAAEQKHQHRLQEIHKLGSAEEHISAESVRILWAKLTGEYPVKVREFKRWEHLRPGERATTGDEMPAANATGRWTYRTIWKDAKLLDVDASHRTDLDVLVSRFKSKADFRAWLEHQTESLDKIEAAQDRERARSEMEMQNSKVKAAGKLHEQLQELQQRMTVARSKLTPAQKKKLEGMEDEHDKALARIESMAMEREGIVGAALEKIKKMEKEGATDEQIQDVINDRDMKLHEHQQKMDAARKKMKPELAEYLEAKQLFDEVFYLDNETNRWQVNPKAYLGKLVYDPALKYFRLKPYLNVAYGMNMTLANRPDVSALMSGKHKEDMEFVLKALGHLREPDRSDRYSVYNHEINENIARLKKQKAHTAARMLGELQFIANSEIGRRRFTAQEVEKELKRIVRLSRSDYAEDHAKYRELQARREGKVLPKSVTPFIEELAFRAQAARKENVASGKWKTDPAHIRDAKTFLVLVSTYLSGMKNLSIAEKFIAQDYIMSWIGGKGTRKERAGKFMEVIWQLGDEARFGEAPNNPFERKEGVIYSFLRDIKSRMNKRAKGIRSKGAAFELAHAGGNTGTMSEKVRERDKALFELTKDMTTYLDHTNPHAHRAVGKMEDDKALLADPGKGRAAKRSANEEALRQKLEPEAHLMQSHLVTTIVMKPRRKGSYDSKKLRKRTDIPEADDDTPIGGFKIPKTKIAQALRTSRERRVPGGPVTKKFVYDQAMTIAVMLDGIREQGRSGDWPEGVARIEKMLHGHIEGTSARDRREGIGLRMKMEDIAALHRVLNNEMVLIKSQKATIPEGFDERTAQNVIRDLGELAGQKATKVDVGNVEKQDVAREGKFSLVSLTLDTDSPRVNRILKSVTKRPGVDRLSMVFNPRAATRSEDHIEVIDNGDGTYNIKPWDMPRGGSVFRNMGAAEAADTLVASFVDAGFDENVSISDLNVGDVVAGGFARPIVKSDTMGVGEQAVGEAMERYVQEGGMDVGKVLGEMPLDAHRNEEKTRILDKIQATDKALASLLDPSQINANMAKYGGQGMAKMISNMKATLKNLHDQSMRIDSAVASQVPTEKTLQLENQWVVSGKVTRVDKRTKRLRVVDKKGKEYEVSTAGSVYRSSKSPKDIADGIPDIKGKSRVRFTSTIHDPTAIFRDYAIRMGFKNWVMSPHTAIATGFGHGGYMALVDEGFGDYSIYQTSTPILSLPAGRIGNKAFEGAGRTGQVISVVLPTNHIVNMPTATDNNELTTMKDDRVPRLFKGRDIDPMDAEYDAALMGGYEPGLAISDAKPGQKVMFVALVDGLAPGDLDGTYEVIEGEIAEINKVKTGDTETSSIVVRTPAGAREVMVDDIMTDELNTPREDHELSYPANEDTPIGSLGPGNVRSITYGLAETDRSEVANYVVGKSDSVKKRKPVAFKGDDRRRSLFGVGDHFYGISYDYALMWRVPSHLKKPDWPDENIHAADMIPKGMGDYRLEGEMTDRVVAVVRKLRPHVGSVGDGTLGAGYDMIHFMTRAHMGQTAPQEVIDEAREIISDQIKYLIDNFAEANQHINVAEAVSALAYTMIVTDPKQNLRSPEDIRKAGHLVGESMAISSALNKMAAAHPILLPGTDIPFVYNVTNRIGHGLRIGQPEFVVNACVFQTLGNVAGMAPWDVEKEASGIYRFMGMEGENASMSTGVNYNVFAQMLRNKKFRRVEMTAEMMTAYRAAELSKIHDVVVMLDRTGHVLSAVNGVVMNADIPQSTSIHEIWVPENAEEFRAANHGSYAVMPDESLLSSARAKREDMQARELGEDIVSAAKNNGNTLKDMRENIMSMSSTFYDMVKETKMEFDALVISRDVAESRMKGMARMMLALPLGEKHILANNKLFASFGTILNDIHEKPFAHTVGNRSREVIDYMENIYLPQLEAGLDEAMRIGSKRGLF